MPIPPIPLPDAALNEQDWQNDMDALSWIPWGTSNDPLFQSIQDSLTTRQVCLSDLNEVLAYLSVLRNNYVPESTGRGEAEIAPGQTTVAQGNETDLFGLYPPIEGQLSSTHYQAQNFF